MTSSAAKKLADELSRSSVFKTGLARAVLDVELRSISGNSQDVVPIIELLNDRIVETLNRRVVRFLEKYEPVIRSVCNNRRYYLGEESRDCEQFIRLSLCKLYKKRYAYTNFDKVVRSAIKRKAIDYSKSRNVSLKMTVTETDLMHMIDDEKTGDDIGLYKDEIISEEAVNYDLLLGIFKLRKMIGEASDGDFTDWDRCMADAICRGVENGVVEIDDILAGFENKAEAVFRFRVFAKRVRKHFDRRMFL